MLVETISGRCPICSYNKLFQRYGSFGYFQMDACPSCGFAYGEDRDNDSITINHISDFSICIFYLSIDYYYILKDEFSCQSIGGNLSHCSKLSDLIEFFLSTLDKKLVQYLLFDFCEKKGRYDDIKSTIFNYNQTELAFYILKNEPTIFNSHEKKHLRDTNKLRKKAEKIPNIMREFIRRSWNGKECTAGVNICKTKDVGSRRDDVNGSGETLCLQPF